MRANHPPRLTLGSGTTVARGDPVAWSSLHSLIVPVRMRDSDPNELEGDLAWLSHGDS